MTDTQDLLIDPTTREVKDVAHKIVAVGSRSVESAQKFVNKLKASEGDNAWGVKNGVLDNAKAYGTYDEVYSDPVSRWSSWLCHGVPLKNVL